MAGIDSFPQKGCPDFEESLSKVILLDNISKTFQSGRGLVKAIDGVSLRVESRSSLVLFGKSGSGKTTLLNCIGGLDRPESGKVTVFDVDLHALSEKSLCLFQRSNIGFIFQHSNLLNYLSVFQNIAFPLELNRVEKSRIKRRVRDLLDITGLNGIEKAMPDELSGGEAQRVAFARAIAHSPKLILADEPTASLDSETGKDLVRFMFDMGRERQCIMIIATHDREVMGLADMKVQMRDGKIIWED
jgi:ABC-type lipoprotein export system ATPase subunit